MNQGVTETEFSALDVQNMQLALQLARQAWQLNEVPVGAVLCDAQGQPIATGYNRVISSADPTQHAEIVALRQACAQLQNYRLPHSQLFVSLEPCMMCLGALLQARIQRIVYAAPDPKTGVCGSVLDLAQPHPTLNHQTVIQSGLLAAQSAQLLRDFFKERRLHAKQQRKNSS